MNTQSNSPLRRVMLDLETFGQTPGSVIVALGAVVFDENGPDPDRWIYHRIDAESCVQAGLKMDTSTVLWWMQQSQAARDELGQESIPLIQALTLFATWLHELGDNLQMWGKGPSFDCALLAAAYRAIGGEPPWRYSRERCVRTLAGLWNEPEPIRDGTHHNALDDARHQASHMASILRRLPATVVQWADTPRVPLKESEAPHSPCMGFFGPCKGTPLSKESIGLLKTGDNVEVVWLGGNGPHIYYVRNDLDLYQLERTPRARSTEQLLKHARFVALVSGQSSAKGKEAGQEQAGRPPEP